MYIEMVWPNFKTGLWIILLLLFGQFCQFALADTIESLVMPGPVIEGHKKYEQTCKKCHSVFSKEKQDSLCRHCHKEIARDIAAKRGYHGRLGNKIICKSCHTEHKGRTADIVKFNRQIFDHDKTDFTLAGRHKNASCEQCHKQGKKYRDTSSQCGICHKKVNPHHVEKLLYRNKLMDCTACHTAGAWEDIVFRHEKTKFKLQGKHEPVKCAGCHPNDQYSKTPVNCYACHKFDDVHKRKKGKQCGKCHNPETWRSLKFNHDKETKFPLQGRHKRLQCHDCHKQDPYRVKIKKDCISCHKVDDKHNDRYGNKCDKCHAASSWKKVKFSHDSDTEFRLLGRHKGVACEACHNRNAYEHKTSQLCVDCHKKDDVHEAQQGKDCKRCHNEASWRKKVMFDHDITRFPLLGLHAALGCEECHLKNTYKDADRECRRCHRKDDVHKGRLGNQCQMCHNPNGWRVWEFDHNQRTKFKLDGKHAKLHCHDCHKHNVSNIKNQLGTCNDCHAADDTHDGQFGRDCARCHTSKSFKNARLR